MQAKANEAISPETLMTVTGGLCRVTNATQNVPLELLYKGPPATVVPPGRNTEIDSEKNRGFISGYTEGPYRREQYNPADCPSGGWVFKAKNGGRYGLVPVGK